jgi:hypothetical protein
VRHHGRLRQKPTSCRSKIVGALTLGIAVDRITVTPIEQVFAK